MISMVPFFMLADLGLRYPNPKKAIPHIIGVGAKVRKKVAATSMKSCSENAILLLRLSTH